MMLDEMVDKAADNEADKMVEEVAEIERLDDGTILVDAKMILEDVNETLDIDLPIDGPETLGGYLYDKFGHAPDVGETVLVDDIKFAIEGVQRNRITWVKVERLSEEDLTVLRDEREQVA